MADDKIKIDVEVDAKAATDALKKVGDAIENVEKETKKATVASRAWAAANADLGKMSEPWKKLGEDVGKVAGAFAGLAIAGVAVMAHAEQQEQAIRRLGSAYDAVSAATNGAMSAQQALTLQGQIQAAGVRVNSQQLGLLARAAREYAQATGNDAVQAVEKLTNAIVNNSEDALSELGLAQARATTSTQTLANMTRELENRFRGVAPAARTLNEDLEKLPQVMSFIGNAAAQAAAGGLRSFIDALHGAGTAAAIWRDITNFADDRRNIERQGQSQDAMNRRQALRERIQRQAQGVGARFNSDLLQGMSERELQSVSSRLEVGTGVRGQSARGGDLNAVFGSIVAQNDLNLNMNGQFEGIVNAVRNEERMRQRREAAGEARPVDENVRVKESIAKSMNAAGDAAGNAATAFERAAKRIELSGTAVIDLVASAAEAAGGRGFRNRLQTAASALGLTSGTDAEQSELFGGIADSMEGGGATNRAERSRRSRIAERDRETRNQSISRGRGVGAGILRGLGVSADAMETESRMMQGYADTIVGTLGKVGDAFTRHIELVMSGQETIGQAMLNGVHEIGKALAMEAAPKALMELAAGFAALTNPVTIATAPMHFTAAGIYGAVAAAGGIAAGVTGALGAGQTPQGAGNAASMQSARSLAPRSSNAGASPRDLAPVTVVMSSLVPAGPSDAQRARNGLRDARRRGFADGNYAPRKVEH